MATLVSVLSDYETNADYDEAKSVTKARAFVTACRKLLAKMARDVQSGGAGGERIAMDTRLIAEEMREAKAWLASSGAEDGSVIFSDFSEYR